MLDPEMIEDTVKIMNEATNGKIQVNLITDNHAGGNANEQEICDVLWGVFGEYRAAFI